MALLSEAGLRRWHRRIGLVACLGVVVFSLSGALHPLMSRYQPQPATRAPPALERPADSWPAPGPLLAAQGIGELVRARLVTWPAGSYWQVDTGDSAGPLRYFAATDGAELADGDARYAEFLARHYLGEPAAPVERLERLTRFEGEYAYVNRLLPVYRVSFHGASGRRAYVDPATSQLATVVDDRKALFNTLFATVHLWRFFGDWTGPRLALASVMLGAMLIVPVLGIAIFLRGRARRIAPREPARRLHRRFGLLVAVTLGASAASGLWHLVESAGKAPLRARAAPRIADAFPVGMLPPMPVLPPGPLAELALERRGEAVAYRWRQGGGEAGAAAAHHGHGAHAGDHGTVPAADAAYARTLAVRFSGLPETAVTDVQLVTAFDGEYGFINKRLPVHRVGFDTPAADRYYVHLDTATLAAHVNRRSFAEGWTFANLHKWQFLDTIVGKWPRDLLQIGFALLNTVVALLGVLIFARRPRRRRAGDTFPAADSRS